MICTFPDLTVERDRNGLIHLRQRDGCGDEDVVVIHTWQLQYVAEQCGIVPKNDPHAARTIARLERQLRLLAERCGQLAYWLANHSDHEHANLQWEQTYAEGTAAMADEFTAQLNDGAQAHHTEPCAATTSDQAWAPAPVEDQANLFQSAPTDLGVACT